MSQSTTTKFLFDTAFDTDVQDQRSEPETPTYSQQQLLAARAEAFSEGAETGREETRRDAQQHTARALEAIDAKLGSFVRSQQDHNDAMTRQALEVAIAIARKCAPVAAERGAADEIEQLVRGCLGNLIDEPRVVVRVNEDLVEPVKARIDALTDSRGFSGTVVLLGDAELKPADCKVMWPDGGIERSSERLWQEIDQAVERALEHWPATTPDAGATTQPQEA